MKRVIVKKTAVRRHWEHMQEVITPDLHAGEDGTLIEELDSDVPAGVVRFENGDEDMYPLTELEEGRDEGCITY